jgi:hypothetical protein
MNGVNTLHQHMLVVVHNRNGFPIEWAVSVERLRYRL